MAEYTFKCQVGFWDEVLTGLKSFEVRMHDPERPVKAGDTIYLKETFYSAETGRKLRAMVFYVFPLSFLGRFYKPPCASKDGFLIRTHTLEMSDVRFEGFVGGLIK